MLVKPAVLAGLGLLLQRVQAAPQAVPLESDLISILEKIHADTPIVWHEVVNADGSKSNVTDIDNTIWDDAVAQLVPRNVAVAKRQSRSCFGSGSWAKQSVLKDGVSEACIYLKDTPFGQTRLYQRAGFNSAGDAMTVHYTKQRSISSTDPVGFECNNALTWLIDNCYGSSQDSRGGYVNWPSGNRYGVDPQTHNCNC